MSRRLGFLGPVIVLVGAIAAAFGVWWMIRARSEATTFVDVLAIDADLALAVRRERTSARAFVELRHRDGKVSWQAMVPPYAGQPGAPGLAASPDAVSVRVVRDQRGEVFGLSMRNAAKLGGLLLARNRPRDPRGFTLPAAVTLHDGASSYELFGREGSEAWAVVASINLTTGKQRWHVELGAVPIRAAGLVPGALWLRQGAAVRVLSTADGAELTGQAAAAGQAAAEVAAAASAEQRVLFDDGVLRITFERAARAVQVRRGDAAPVLYPWPEAALEPWPYHLAGGRLWVVLPDRLQVLAVDEAARAEATLPRP